MRVLPARTSPLGAALAALVPLLTALLLAVGLARLVALSPPAEAAGFDPGWAWQGGGLVLDPGDDAPDGARLEVLPDGSVIALLIAEGADHGHAGQSVLVSRVRTTAGVWGAPGVVPLGSGAVWGRTMDTFVDSAGRVLVVWAEKSVAAPPAVFDGHWTVRSVARGPGGWTAPTTVHEVQTLGGYADTTEASLVRPVLVGSGDTATVAWTSVVGSTGTMRDIAAPMFHARRWSAGTWGATIVSDGYGSGQADIPPVVDAAVRVMGDAKRVVRAADGRISIAYTLLKSRPIRTTSHPLTPQPGVPNVPNVWDGVPETPWEASSKTAMVVHLDPGDGSWSSPVRLATSMTPVVCVAPDLPSNPPLSAHWSQWQQASVDDGIHSACGGSESVVRDAAYRASGALDVGLSYKASPRAVVRDLVHLDIACDAAGSDIYRFCFDEWDSVTWGVSWPNATVTIAAGASAPPADSVSEGPWAAWSEIGLVTGASTVTVRDRVVTGGRHIVLDRSSGTDVTWSPDAGASATVQVADAFAHGGDVAVFYDDLSNGNVVRCGMVVLRAGAGAVEGPIGSCAAGSRPDQRDVVQLADGRLAQVDGSVAGAPLRIFGPGGAPTTTQATPTTPTTPTSPTSPPGPKPTAAPAAPTTFTLTAAPVVSGKARVGARLTASTGRWSPAPSRVAFQWYAGKKAIAKATKARLKVTAKLRGKKVSVRVTVTRPGVAAAVRVVRAGKVR